LLESLADFNHAFYEVACRQLLIGLRQESGELLGLLIFWLRETVFADSSYISQLLQK
jgi:hypothetical protein